MDIVWRIDGDEARGGGLGFRLGQGLGLGQLSFSTVGNKANGHYLQEFCHPQEMVRFALTSTSETLTIEVSYQSEVYG